MIGKIVKVEYFGQIVHAICIRQNGPHLTLSLANRYQIKTTINNLL